MKEYKVESRIYHSKMTRNREHILESSTYDIQKIIDDYAAKGWIVASTDLASFGTSMYYYVYFERDVS